MYFFYCYKITHLYHALNVLVFNNCHLSFKWNCCLVTANGLENMLGVLSRGKVVEFF